MHMFGVFDGHGELGTECALFATHQVNWGRSGTIRLSMDGLGPIASV